VTDASPGSLARRDLQVAAGGTAAFLACLLLLALGALGLMGDRLAESLVVVIALVAGFACFVWWLAGPTELRRERLLVVAPVFLLAIPGLVALGRLGGGVAAVLVATTVGFSAAIALGMAAARRRD
jgi:hypothetical protein